MVIPSDVVYLGSQSESITLLASTLCSVQHWDKDVYDRSTQRGTHAATHQTLPSGGGYIGKTTFVGPLAEWRTLEVMS